MTIIIDRTFDAPRLELWAAWIRAERFAKWFNPWQGDAEVQRLDAVVGGHVVFDLIDEDGNHDHHDEEFLEIEAPNRFVTKERHGGVTITMTVSFSEHGEGTRLTIRQEGMTPDMEAAAPDGWSATLDKLAAFVEGHDPS